MNARSLLILLTLVAAAACKPRPDLGDECRMYGRNPDGGRTPVLIRESRIKIGANKDFISFGSTDCENLTCVRDADFIRSDAGTDGGADPVAVGYCSDKCLAGSTCASSNPDDDNDAKKRLNCRALLLDEETLKALCAAGQCLPGNIKSPYFCARGGLVPDAGI